MAMKRLAASALGGATPTMAMKRPAASALGGATSKRVGVTPLVVEEAASSQGVGEHVPPDDDLFIGFVVTFEDPSAMLEVASALHAKQTGRQNTAMDWSSLLRSDSSFALRASSRRSRRACLNWVTYCLRDLDLTHTVEPVSVWPPPEFGSAGPAPMLVAKAPVARTPGAKTPAHKTPAANTPAPSAAASSQPQAASAAASSQQLSPWPQHKVLKLMLSSVSLRLPGPVTPQEWLHSLGAELGRGTFGTVYKVSRQGQEYAVKVMQVKDKADAIQASCTARVFVLNSL